MNMQLSQCFSRAETEKSQKRPEFVWLFLFPKTAKGVQKKPEFQNLASKKANWQP